MLLFLGVTYRLRTVPSACYTAVILAVGAGGNWFLAAVQGQTRLSIDIFQG